MKIIKLILPLLILLFITTACQNTEEEIKSDLIGEWLSSKTSSDGTTFTDTLVFEPNGNFQITLETIAKNENQESVSDTQTGYGTFEIKENQVILNYNNISGSIKLPMDISSEEFLGMNSSGPATYTYSVEGEKLVLTHDNPTYQIGYEKGTVI